MAAIGTICDVMPMQDENRSIVKLGLANFNHKSLLKIAESANCSKQITAGEISMKIAPRINAAGRIGSPQAALDVLLCRDKADSAKIGKLLELNEQRRVALDEILEESDALCDYEVIKRERMVFIYSDGWQHGLLGLIANRLKEKYNVPAIVMTLDGDNYVGSARGIEAVDLFDVFSKCKDCLVKFGGHKASLGFSVAKERLNELRAALANVLAGLDGSCFERYVYYDLELGKDCAASEALALSDRLQPSLTQDKIICRVRDNVKSASTFGKESNHLLATLSSGLEIKGFNYGKYASIIRNGANVDLLCSVVLDTFSGNVCGMIEDVTLTNSVCFDDLYKLNLLKNFTPEPTQFAGEKEIAKLLASDSVAVVFDDYETYLAYCDRYDFDDYAVDIFFDNSASSKTVVVSPVEGYCFDKYDNVVCFAKDGIRRKLPAKTRYAEVQCARDDLYQLPLDREVCLAVYAVLKRKDRFDSVKGVYDKYLSSKLTYPQFVVATRVFEELGLVKVVDNFNVEFPAAEKTDLTNSKIYKTFQSK